MTVRYNLVPRRPYSLARTAARLVRFPERVDRFEDGVFRRLVFVKRKPLLVQVRQEGSPSRATLRLTLHGDVARSQETRTAAAEVLDRVLGTSTDVRPFYLRFRDDPLLGPMISEHFGLRVAGRLRLWDTLIQIVLSQQINLTLAHDILCELVQRYGRSARLDGARYFAFPTTRRFAALTETELRGFRLSRAKASTLIGLARAFEAGEISDGAIGAMDDEKAVESLMSFKGVGRWTAEFALLRGGARMDIFPGGDLGVVKYLREICSGMKARRKKRRCVSSLNAGVLIEGSRSSMPMPSSHGEDREHAGPRRRQLARFGKTRSSVSLRADRVRRCIAGLTDVRILRLSEELAKSTGASDLGRGLSRSQLASLLRCLQLLAAFSTRGACGAPARAPTRRGTLPQHDAARRLRFRAPSQRRAPAFFSILGLAFSKSSLLLGPPALWRHRYDDRDGRGRRWSGRAFQAIPRTRPSRFSGPDPSVLRVLHRLCARRLGMTEHPSHVGQQCLRRAERGNTIGVAVDPYVASAATI